MKFDKIKRQFKYQLKINKMTQQLKNSFQLKFQLVETNFFVVVLQPNKNSKKKKRFQW